MKEHIIGRTREIERLQRYMASDHSEFIAIYGRRRIGKTFLVRELFESEFAFRITAKENATTREQLMNFAEVMQRMTGTACHVSDWSQAFRMLANYIEQDITTCPKIIFFDELPWFDTRGTKFVSALEHFWNDWASYRHDIKLIVCGSATTWMLNKVLNARGGLHNRVTHSMLLEPFTLRETELYFRSRGFNYDRNEILECYMAMGGVAHYLSLFEIDKSVAQNIDMLCFTRGGELVTEFNRMLMSLFRKAEKHIAVITALQTRGMGLTREDIIEQANQVNNGNLTTLLRELEECDFIRSYVPFGKAKKDKLYQLIDPFILFHFRFMHRRSNLGGNYWIKMQSKQDYKSWCGYAFEVVCLNHIEQLVHALGIDGSINTPCSWSYRPSPLTISNSDDEDLKHRAQIDLLIDRSDQTINICEMKFSHNEYVITADNNEIMARRLRIFSRVTKTHKSLQPVYITPHGLANNAYARRMPRTITANDLFT